MSILQVSENSESVGRSMIALAVGKRLCSHQQHRQQHQERSAGEDFTEILLQSSGANFRTLISYKRAALLRLQNTITHYVFSASES